MLLLVEITSLLNPKNERVKKTATYFDSHRFFGIYHNYIFKRSKLLLFLKLMQIFLRK